MEELERICTAVSHSQSYATPRFVFRVVIGCCVLHEKPILVRISSDLRVTSDAYQCGLLFFALVAPGISQDPEWA